MRTCVYFIRHGESLSNVDPSFEGEDILSDVGTRQAELVSSRFKHVKIEGLYHSGILRALKTAEEIQKVTGVEPTLCDFLKERKGSFSEGSDFRYDETFEELKGRLYETKRFLESISYKNVVVIGHAIFLKSFVGYLMLGDQLTEDLLKGVEDTLVAENTGVSKFVFNKEKSKWRIMSWNDRVHLAE